MTAERLEEEGNSWEESDKRLFEAGLERQVRGWAPLAKEIGLTEREYATQLVEIIKKKDLYDPEAWGRIGFPLFVETRIPLAKILELARITPYYDLKMIKDWRKGEFRTPQVPYFTWVDWVLPLESAWDKNFSAQEMRNDLVAGERPPGERLGTVLDGIGLILDDPKMLESQSLTLPGSEVGSAAVPDLELWEGRRVLSARSADSILPFPKYRYAIVVCSQPILLAA